MAKPMGITGKFILAFVTILLGAVLIAVIAGTTNATTSVSSAGPETQLISGDSNNITFINATDVWTVAQPPTGWKITDCPLTNFVLKNQSGYVLPEGVTQAYVLNANAGTYTLRNTAGTLQAVMNGGKYNSTYVSYNYCPDVYVNSTFGRSAINLIAGFFAIALMLVGVGLFYSIGKEVGIV